MPFNNAPVDDVIPCPGHQHSLPAWVKLWVARLAVPKPLAVLITLAFSFRQSTGDNPVLRPRTLELICSAADDVAEAKARPVQEHPAVEVVAPEGRALIHDHPLKDGMLLVGPDGAHFAVSQSRPGPLLHAVVPILVILDVSGSAGGRPA